MLWHPKGIGIMGKLNTTEKLVLTGLLLILFLLVGIRYWQAKSHEVHLSVVREEASVVQQ